MKLPNLHFICINTRYAMTQAGGMLKKTAIYFYI